jgi:hypothetical protein
VKRLGSNDPPRLYVILQQEPVIAPLKPLATVTCQLIAFRRLSGSNDSESVSIRGFSQSVSGRRIALDNIVDIDATNSLLAVG